MTMKILALNSSPRPENISKTSKMLNALIKGMCNGGAEVKKKSFYTKKTLNLVLVANLVQPRRLENAFYKMI